MTVELLDNNQSGVLDLIGGNNEPTKDTVVEGEDGTTETTEEQTHASDDLSGSEEKQEEQETTDVDGDDVPSGDDSDSDSDSSESDVAFFFGDTQVNVEVPDEVSNALKEAGVDSQELLKELFAEGGDFSLKEETRTKLEDKFGKTMVDGYLNMYKTMNQQTIDRIESDKQSAEATDKQRGEEYSSAVGGADGLAAMEGFILEHFDENQLSAYNAVMETDDHNSQMLIISQVKAQMQLADKLANGDKNIKLIGDNSSSSSVAASPIDKGYLTYDEYQNLIEEDKYWTDREYSQKVDAARIAGKRKQL
ncbi:head scaffolding protein [Vibrio phage D529]